MALIVEDGSIVAGANTYVSDATYVAYAASRGYTIGATEAEREIELFNGMDFIESHRDQFKGLKVSQGQDTQWPRYSVYLDGFQLDSNVIPIELKRAQMEASVLSRTTSLTPSGAIQNVQSESIGELSVSYYSGGSYQTVQMKNVDQFLDCLLNVGGPGGKMRAVRV